MLQALLFALPHFTVAYTTDTVGLVLLTFRGGLLFGALARLTGSLIAPILLRAGIDVPIWLGILSKL